MASAQSTSAHKVRQAELARILDVKRQSINELVKRGLIPIDADGLIDVELAKAALLARVHPGSKTATVAAGPQTPAPAPSAPANPGPTAESTDEATPSYHVAKTLREAAEAQIARLKLAEMRGEVVKKSEVDRAAFDAARHLRDGLTNCSRRLGATVAVLTTPDECAAAIEREHRALLQSWAKTMGVASPAPQDPAA